MCGLWFRAIAWEYRESVARENLVRAARAPHIASQNDGRPIQTNGIRDNS